MTAEHLIIDPILLSVLRAAEEARRQCLELTDLIAQNHITEDPSDEQFDARRKVNARLALLRGVNRNAVKSVRATKQETTEARQEIDSLHLELQNLRYEQGHLRGEIRGCEGFDHKYTRLPMIPTGEFLALHPEHADSNDHDLTLARIADEHVARQELEKQRQELVERKEALVKETNLKKEELGKLDSEVGKWLGGQDNVRKIFEKRANQGN